MVKLATWTKWNSVQMEFRSVELTTATSPSLTAQDQSACVHCLAWGMLTGGLEGN